MLRLKGYRILARRFVVSGGEIDLIARRGGSIAFVEVKARADLEIAAISISATKRRRIARAARVWLARNPWAAASPFAATPYSSRPGAFPVTRRPRIGWKSTDLPPDPPCPDALRSSLRFGQGDPRARLARGSGAVAKASAQSDLISSARSISDDAGRPQVGEECLDGWQQDVYT